MRPVRVLLRRHPAVVARTWSIVALDGDKQRALGMVGQLATDHPRLPILTVSARQPGPAAVAPAGGQALPDPAGHPGGPGRGPAAVAERSCRRRPSRPGGSIQAAEGGRPDHQRARVAGRGRVHEHRGQPGRHPGQPPGQPGGPDRPGPGHGGRRHRHRAAGQRQPQHGGPGPEHRAAGHELPEAGAGQAPGDRLVRPPPPAGDPRNRGHPRRPRRTHSKLAQDQLHPPDPGPE